MNSITETLLACEYLLKKSEAQGYVIGGDRMGARARARSGRRERKNVAKYQPRVPDAECVRLVRRCRGRSQAAMARELGMPVAKFYALMQRGRKLLGEDFPK